MSVQALGWVLEQEDLPPSPKLVLVAIANHADHTDGYCWLKFETIGREAACSPRNAQRVVAALVRNGYLRKEIVKGKDGKQRANNYWILFDRQPAEWAWFDSKDDDAETPDVVVADLPHDIESPGETPETGFVVSPGPHDNGVVRKDSEEPSKPNPREGFDGGLKGSKPRGYRSPPQGVAATPSVKVDDWVFVARGTRWWDALERHRRKTTGRWVNRIDQHEGKTGHWFRKSEIEAALKTGPPDEAAA